MKIKTLAVVSTAFLHLKGPDGAHLYETVNDAQVKVGIDLYGPGSAQYGRTEERQSARTVKRIQDNDNKIPIVPIETRRAESSEDLADLTAGFRHLEYETDDVTPLAGRELAIAVYSDPTLGWIKEQVVKFVGDWGKFMAGSTPS